jgi:HAD superfamily hydrolase (TIGR01490 family)
MAERSAGRRSRGATAAEQLAEDGSIAIFDLDRTLLEGSSLSVFGRAVRAAGIVRTRTVARHAVTAAGFSRRGIGDGRAARIREALLAEAAGLEYDALTELINRAGPELVGALYVEARWLVDAHLARGDFCVVLSASPQELVDVVRDALGCHRAVGTRLEVVDGRLTGRLSAPFCYGPAKLDRLRAELGAVELASAAAYSDSASDLPLLRAAGAPVAVNPDRRLARVAAGHRWPVLRFGPRRRDRA